MAMSRRRLAVPALVFLGLVVAPAAPAGAEAFIDLYVGKSFTQPSDLKIRQPSRQSDFTFSGVSFDDRSFENPLYYGGRAGYFFEAVPWFGLAMEFFHFKMFAETSDSRRIDGVVGNVPVGGKVPVDTQVQRFDISHGVNYWTLDAIFRYKLVDDPQQSPSGRVQLYAGVGLGPVLTHAKNTVGTVKGNAGYEIAGLGVQGFVGVRGLVWKYFGLFAEYKLTHANLNVGVASGRGRLDELSHHIVGGLTIHLPSF
jgi:lipid A oxidase